MKACRKKRDGGRGGSGEGGRKAMALEIAEVPEETAERMKWNKNLRVRPNKKSQASHSAPRRESKRGLGMLPWEEGRLHIMKGNKDQRGLLSAAGR